MARRQKKIQDFSLLYATLRYYVDLVLKLSYRNIRYVGRQNIPKDGAIIFAPNHTNALMDALVILAMNRSAKVFVARADIFKNRTLAKIFHFLRIMPIMRMRDGLDEVKRNNETIEKAVDVLRDKVPFCIFPEGQHQAKYSSLPLSKGIFRIAFQAQELMPDMPLYIVPVGIRYGNFFRFRSTVRVQIVEPINVGEFIKAHPDNTPQERMNIMRELLDERMKSSILYIPNDDDYNATYEICATVVKSQVKPIKREHSERMNELDVQVPVAGMVKDEFHKTRALVTFDGENYCEINIAKQREVFVFVYKIQEEVHRYSIGRMTQAKRKTVKTSSLTKIEGIGPAKAKALLAAFGGYNGVKNASAEALKAVKGINSTDILRIRAYFEKKTED